MKIAGSFFLFILSEFRKKIVALHTNSGDLQKDTYTRADGTEGHINRPNGTPHEPNTDGYQFQTSGGTYEGVMDRVPNTPENVSHTTISGWAKDEPASLTTTKNTEAYYSDEKKLEGVASKDHEAKGGMPTTAASTDPTVKSGADGMSTTAVGKAPSGESDTKGPSAGMSTTNVGGSGGEDGKSGMPTTLDGKSGAPSTSTDLSKGPDGPSL